jgi:Coatomer gamma subunit appendage platform subdomain
MHADFESLSFLLFTIFLVFSCSFSHPHLHRASSHHAHTQVPLMNLELALKQYVKGTCDAPFDIRSVPAIPLVTATPSTSTGASAAGDRSAAKKTEAASAIYAKMLAEVPEFATYGPLFKTTSPVPLTETETEYLVTCVKHIFASHIVFQVGCRFCPRSLGLFSCVFGPRDHRHCHQ